MPKLFKRILPLSFIFLLFVFFAVSTVNAYWVGGPYPGYSTTNGKSEIEWKYDKFVTGNLTELHLATNRVWSSGGTYNLDLVYLKVNNILVGTPTAYDSTYDWDSNFHALVWEITNVELTNDEILIEIDFDSFNSGQSMLAVTAGDIDDDGDHNYRYSTSDVFWNGTLDGTYSVNYDFKYAMQIEEFTSVNITQIIGDYKQTFGDFFMEFYNYDEACEYRVGEKPFILYSLNTSLYSDGDGYKWEIVDSDQNVKDSGIITLVNADENGSFEGIKTFGAVGMYQIRLYNLSENLSKDENVYNSQVITVCEKYSTVEEEEEEQEEIDNTSINLMIGLFISIGLGVGLLMITHEPMAMVIGTGTTAFILSQPVLGDYNYLPVELGYGLIVVLVLVAVIIWLLN